MSHRVAWYVFDSEDRPVIYPTQELAKEAAESALESMLGDYWAEYVDRLEWGRIEGEFETDSRNRVLSFDNGVQVFVYEVTEQYDYKDDDTVKAKGYDYECKYRLVAAAEGTESYMF